MVRVETCFVCFCGSEFLHDVFVFFLAICNNNFVSDDIAVRTYTVY